MRAARSPLAPKMTMVQAPGALLSPLVLAGAAGEFKIVMTATVAQLGANFNAGLSPGAGFARQKSERCMNETFWLASPDIFPQNLRARA